MNNLREILPEDQRRRLDRYTEEAAATSPKGDFHRARHCLHWAVATAERPEHSHIAHVAIRLKETHKAWQDVWLGTEFGTEIEIGRGQASQEVRGDQKIGPSEDIELLWVQEATDVAQSAAERSGWDSVPWEELLCEVLQIK
jgi:hypothetical protein